jgi:flagellar biosynthesis/type III secretory pathway chaperone
MDMQPRAPVLFAVALLLAAALPIEARRLAPVKVRSGNTGSLQAPLSPLALQPLSVSLTPTLTPLNGSLPNLTGPLPQAAHSAQATTLAIPAKAVIAPTAAQTLTLPAATRLKTLPVTEDQAVQQPVTTKGSLRKLSQQLETEDSGKSPDQRLDAAFDGREINHYLREDWELPFQPAEAARYKQAKSRLGRRIDSESATELADAGAALAQSAGIQVRRKIYKFGRDSYQGFEVVPVAGASRLNEIALQMKNDLGVTMDYVPERTRGATAMYNTFESRLYLPSFDDEDSYAAILHEVRHAYFTGLLRKGDTRLYHFAIVALRNQRLAPNAIGYSSYLSLEELTTYPKTLRHQVMRARKLTDPEAVKRQLSKINQRIYQYAEIIDSANFNIKALKRRQSSDNREAVKLHPEHQRSHDLGVPPGGAQYMLRVPYSYIYIPVEREAKPTRWQRWFGRQDQMALAVADLKIELLSELIAEVSPLLKEFDTIINEENPRLASAQMLANRIIGITKEKDEAFVARYAQLREGK